MSKGFDASIPVLTEVVREEPAPAAAAEPAAAPAEILGTDWPQFEREISERILQQLQARVDFVLEQRIRDSIAGVLGCFPARTDRPAARRPARHPGPDRQPRRAAGNHPPQGTKKVIPAARPGAPRPCPVRC
jgi:hypothetical protein